MMEKTVLSVRIPEDLHAELKKVAEAEDRSLNNLINLFLRKAVNEYKARQQPES